MTKADIDAKARAQVRADEQAITGGGRRRSVTLGDAWRGFWRHPSPFMIAPLLLGSLVSRVIVGDWRLWDGLLAVVMVAAFPFYAWMIHVCILHWRPRRVGRLTIDPLLARKHREHHVDPRDVPLIFIPWQALIWLILGNVAIGLFAFPRLGLGLTFLTVI